MHQPLIHIIEQFHLYGDLQEYKSWGGGHINDTFLLQYNQGGIFVRYILQKINKSVFLDPDAVTQNISLVCKHISNKWRNEGIKDITRRCLTIIPTKKGRPVYIDEKGDYWRVFLFIENSVAFDFVEKTSHAFEAAKAFARFQLALEGLPTEQISETIPNFHHLGKRFDTFKQALTKNKHGRKKHALQEIDFALNHEFLIKIIQEALEKKEIPYRIIHNDTKLSNVLLDADTGEGLCVIDLDTLMPGTLLYDFGDMVRTFTSPVPEDEQEVSKVKLQLDIFKFLCMGYLPEMKKLLVPKEKELLLIGAKHMTFIMGIRFLTDYLMGDVYYKTKFPTHNLIRARNQFTLLKSIEAQEIEMQKIIDSLLLL